MRPTWDQIVTYAEIGDPPNRCPSAESRDGYRCARLPGHGGRCVAITEEGALRRFAYAEPHADQTRGARCVEESLRGSGRYSSAALDALIAEFDKEEAA